METRSSAVRLPDHKCTPFRENNAAFAQFLIPGQEKVATSMFAHSTSTPDLALFARLEFLQVYPQLLALLIKMASLESESFGGIGDVMVVAFDFIEDHLPLELFYASGERPCARDHRSPATRGRAGQRRADCLRRNDLSLRE